MTTEDGVLEERSNGDITAQSAVEMIHMKGGRGMGEDINPALVPWEPLAAVNTMHTTKP